MIRTAQRKVKGGKLVRVKVDDDGSRTTLVSITGDFFIYPEEGLNVLEEGLKGIPLRQGAEEILHRLNELISEEDMEIVGFNALDLAEMLEEALR